MKSATNSRAEAIDLIATTLAPGASRLTRLLRRSAGQSELTRTEVGLLLTLLDGPRRITELAATEALAQPTVTQLVDKLQKRGLVARERSGEDGRVVLVSISMPGRELLESVRAEARAVVRATVAELGDEDLVELVAAAAALERLADALARRSEPA